ncbi:hypothetical protein BASA81_002272 [Batrachochytrium salamandrivorans]|nr:hypothetical protein BASA81_002272 [Batrachochytrium salamandrivorans]
MPYLALRLGQWQRTRTRLYNVLLVLLVAYGLGMITWYLSTKPTNLFEAIGVVPDVTTSLPLRIQMNKLLAKGGKVPDELLRAAKALVNDDQRRRYIMHGPNMEMDFTGLVAWNLECLLFLCSLASSKHGGEGTSMLVLVALWTAHGKCLMLWIA